MFSQCLKNLAVVFVADAPRPHVRELETHLVTFSQIKFSFTIGRERDGAGVMKSVPLGSSRLGVGMEVNINKRWALVVFSSPGWDDIG